MLRSKIPKEISELIDGVVVIDKPKGLTSHTVVQKVKRIYKAKKAGHTGTLDPLATGVLPVCLDRATKKAGDLMGGDKEYEVVILLGTETDTYDTEGKVVAKCQVSESIIDKIPEILVGFKGVIMQKPPYYSAVKYKGRPLYKYAREGIFIDVEPRELEIKKFDILGYGAETVTARVVCSKGTYIRSLCHDLGQKLGIGACVKELRRVATGPFHIKDAVTIEQLEELSGSEELLKFVINIGN